MDTALLGAVSAVMGSLVGGSATVATALITQKTQSRRELLREQAKKREALYGEFINECAKLLMDAFCHSLEKPETLLNIYALLNRIRLSASTPVLEEAERLMKRITEQYFARNLTVEQLREIALSKDADPMKAFGEACRLELASLREGL